MANITQKAVDQIFFGTMGNAGDYSSLETLMAIRKAIKNKLGIDLSNAEAHEFWRWRSDQYDASFLCTEPDDHIVSWFEKFVEDWWDGDDISDADPYSD